MVAFENSCKFSGELGLSGSGAPRRSKLFQKEGRPVRLASHTLSDVLGTFSLLLSSFSGRRRGACNLHTHLHTHPFAHGKIKWPIEY